LVEKLIATKPVTNQEADPIIEEPTKQGFTQEQKPWTPGWGSAALDNLVKECPGGPHFSMKQELPKGITLNEAHAGKKVVLVFFIGGCTFTEISAIRFLSKKSEEYNYVVGTTKLINGNTLIESLVEKFEKEDQD